MCSVDRRNDVGCVHDRLEQSKNVKISLRVLTTPGLGYNDRILGSEPHALTAR